MPPFRIIAGGEERQDGSNVLSMAQTPSCSSVKTFAAHSYLNDDVQWNKMLFFHFAPDTNFKGIIAKDNNRMVIDGICDAGRAWEAGERFSREARAYTGTGRRRQRQDVYIYY